MSRGRPLVCAHATPAVRCCDDCRREYKRQYARLYVRRRYARRLGAARLSARTCPRKFGRYGVCGGLLVSDTVDGALVVRCPRCERLERGICADCPAPVVGTRRKARYCALHKKLHHHEAYERSRAANRRKVKARERARERARKAALTPEQLAYECALKRAWRQANPRKVSAQKRRENMRANERRAAYHKRYRDERRAERAERERLRAAGLLPPRTCVSCPAVLTGRTKKCEACKARDRAEARALLAAHYAAQTGAQGVA